MSNKDWNIENIGNHPNFSKTLLELYFPSYHKKKPDRENQYKCVACESREVIDCYFTSEKGTTNLLNHAKSNIHKEHKELALQAILAKEKKPKQSTLVFAQNPIIVNAFNWLTFIINTNSPFSVVENPFYHEYMNLEKISRPTFMNVLELTSNCLYQDITHKLPEKFGLIFDGWTCDHTAVHYIALFAVFPEQENNFTKRNVIMLAFAPLLDESSMSAENHGIFITETLECYSKNIENVMFIVGDNCNTNKAIADILIVPFIGCASHRLNCAVKEIYNSNSKELIEKIWTIMKTLKHIKNRAHLRNYIDVGPVSNNTTRWTSTFNMVNRFLLLEANKSIPWNNDDFKPLKLKPSEVTQLKNLNENLQKIMEVTVNIQSDDYVNFNHLTVRFLFDELIEELKETFPSIEKYCSVNADIVHSPDFEKGIISICSNRPLSDNEKEACKCFEVPINNVTTIVVDPNESLVERAVKKAKISYENIPAASYMKLHWVPFSSNIVERTFSRAKLLINDLRSSMLPLHLENVMMLLMNKHLWNFDTVKRAYINNNNTWAK